MHSPLCARTEPCAVLVCAAYIACALQVMLASLVDMTFISGFFEAMGADKTPAAVWGAIQAAVVATTLL